MGTILIENAVLEGSFPLNLAPGKKAKCQAFHSLLIRIGNSLQICDDHKLGRTGQATDRDGDEILRRMTMRRIWRIEFDGW
jgi:hypothetical protein